VTRAPSQSTLREMRAHLGQPATLAALGGVSAVLALAGPFGTLESLTMAGRLGYWGAVVLATYATGTAIGVSLSARLSQQPPATRVAVTTLATATAATAVVVALNVLLLGAMPDAIGGMSTFAAIFAVAAIVSATLQLTDRSDTRAARDAAPPLLDRLPLDRRGTLVALSVEDHYVRVRTTQGETMLLMRLGDAIREAAPTPGLQVHRSHWVATGAVRAVRRDGDRAVLAMTMGGDIPASRSHIPALREAGLLPRRE
jgi:DNA-binding LytR/AlgR family response regulator